MNSATAGEIKKLHVEATVNFAISYIPSVDEETLVKYLELVNVTGNFGSVSKEQLALKMLLIMKHIPNACEQSLRTLGELLEIPFPLDETMRSAPAKNGKVVGSIAPTTQPAERSVAGWSH